MMEACAARGVLRALQWQAAQEACPGSGWLSPAAHCWQEGCPGSALNSPAEHGMQAEAAPRLKVPARHSVQPQGKDTGSSNSSEQKGQVSERRMVSRRGTEDCIADE